MQAISERLDPQVVCLLDRFFLDGKEQRLPGASRQHRFEILWAKPQQPELECAQLLCGQWMWCYSRNGDWGTTKPIVAVAITDVDEVLGDHGLIFPKTVELRHLEVTFSDRRL